MCNCIGCHFSHIRENSHTLNSYQSHWILKLTQSLHHLSVIWVWLLAWHILVITIKLTETHIVSFQVNMLSMSRVGAGLGLRQGRG